MTKNLSDELLRLRKIILQDDEKRVEALEAELRTLQDHINDTDQLLEKLDPVIADALANKIKESSDEMAEVLAPIMGPAIKLQIQEAKDDVVDALYPVIGQTIRKSIAEAMKTLTKRVNQQIDHALSFRLMFTKIKSRVSGISEGDLLLKDSLPFEIQEVFLIHKKTGLLIAQVSNRKTSPGADEDIISGMLTAIREFANTAFKEEHDRALNEIQYDDLQICMEEGRYAYLAVVVNGIAPDDFYLRLKRCERKIHNLFYKQLRLFEGNTTELEGSNAILNKLIFHFSTPVESNKRQETATAKKKWPKRAAVFSLAIVLLLILLFWRDQTFRWLAPNPTQKQIDLVHIKQQVDTRAPGNESIDYAFDGTVLTVSGSVGSREDKTVIGKIVAEPLPSGMVLNNLQFSAPLTSAYSHDITGTVIHFDQNQSQIHSRKIVHLATVLSFLQTNPEKNIIIHGFSDMYGEESANMLMSKKRAENVRTFLLGAGVDSTRLSVRYWGAKKPVAPNSTSEGRALNRRVEFTITGN
jgi:outer membrane protein OmpA-like peptidoglycan-associated protein